MEASSDLSHPALRSPLVRRWSPVLASHIECLVLVVVKSREGKTATSANGSFLVSASLLSPRENPDRSDDHVIMVAPLLPSCASKHGLPHSSTPSLGAPARSVAHSFESTLL